MKIKLLTLSILAISLSVKAQLMNVNGATDTGAATALFYISDGALVYSGGGVQTKGNGLIDNHGNMMVVGSGSDVLTTKLINGTTDKLDGGNIILRLNKSTPISTDYDAVTYGQLYIDGIAQINASAIISKEYQTAANGTSSYFQQVALPFYDKVLSTLSTELDKTFGTTRFSQNEILKFDNIPAVSRHYTSLATKTSDGTGYYMLGSSNGNLNTSTTLRTLNGMPYTAIPTVTTMQNGGNVNFGNNGGAINEYNEHYNTYLQDLFDLPASSITFTGNYAKNMYQYGNPFFTNLDLSRIGYIEPAAVTDGNNVASIYGVKTSAGVVKTLTNASTYTTGATYVTFAGGIPVADINTLVIKPMQSFVIKLNNSAAETLNFNTLRRFSDVARLDNTNYSVTASKNTGTIKQLGIIALNSNGDELGRSYYVVSPNLATGHQSNTVNSVQVAATAGVIASFEEDPINGMYDYNYTNSYALYVNQANEVDFFGKPIPLALYSSDVTSLKFEIRENAGLVADGTQNLSTGNGFFYKTSTGTIAAISQNMVIPTNGGTEFGLSYGPMTTSVLATGEITKGNRTRVVFNPAIDNYVVQFDPSWKTADVQVFDMSGKLLISGKNVKASQDFIINLSNNAHGTYLVSGANENGEKFTSKIIR